MKTRLLFRLHKFVAIVLGIFLINSSTIAQTNNWEDAMKTRLEKLADSLTNNIKPWIVPNKVFKVDDYGAVADTGYTNTLAIQKAIDDCSAKGGGVVLFSKGDYVTGTIEIKSGVMLEVEQGSRILGSTKLLDYPEIIEQFRSIMSVYYEFSQSLIYAEKAENIGIRGKGEIYFRGEKKNFSSPQTTGKIIGRPLGIRMVECKNVVLQDIFLHNSASWMQNYVHCENLIFDGIRVLNQANYNNDGLDPDGCTNVIVRNCKINSEDDGMCLKGGSNKPSRNILIENSTFYTTCNPLKFGTDTQGDFIDIIVRNCTLGGVPETEPTIAGNQSSTGITIATVDGGNVRNVLISNITINQTRCPVFIRIGNRFRLLPEWGTRPVGGISNVLIENIKGERNFRQGSFISGIKDKSIEDVVIRNMDISMEAVPDSVFAGLPVDENEKGYPDAHQFSVNGLPAYGFFVRHAKNISLGNIKVTPVNNDVRPYFVSGGNTENITANGKSIPAQKLIDYTYEPKYIMNVSLKDEKAKAKVLKFQVGARLYNDRSTAKIIKDSLLNNAEYIQWATNLRSSVADELISFDVTAPGTIYIAHDPTYNLPDWLSYGFENMGKEFKIANLKFYLFRKKIDKAQKITLGGNLKGEVPVKSGSNYIVFFIEKH